MLVEAWGKGGGGEEDKGGRDKEVPMGDDSFASGQSLLLYRLRFTSPPRGGRWLVPAGLTHCGPAGSPRRQSPARLGDNKS